MKHTTDYDQMTTTLRRVNHKMREEDVLKSTEESHPVIEKAARAISDWQSERDWIFQTDRAVRVIEALASELSKEGHKDASDYLRRIVKEDSHKPKSKDAKDDYEEPRRLSQLYF